MVEVRDVGHGQNAPQVGVNRGYRTKRVCSPYLWGPTEAAGSAGSGFLARRVIAQKRTFAAEPGTVLDTTQQASHQILREPLRMI